MKNRLRNKNKYYKQKSFYNSTNAITTTDLRVPMAEESEKMRKGTGADGI